MSDATPTTEQTLESKAEADSGTVLTAKSKVRQGRQGRIRRSAALVAALAIVGTVYSFASPSSAEDTATANSNNAAQVTKGKELFDKSCITCHGANLEGVSARGPSLVGVGAASVYFQVATGRMPLGRQEAQAERKPPKYNNTETLALAAYIGTTGGPQIPDVTKAQISNANLAEGGELFRLNCASCHNFVGEGGALSSGKYAPSLAQATPTDIYTAMLSGPQNMPVFSQNQLSDTDKLNIISYVESLKATTDPGGASIGRTGPVPEGLVIWLAGIGFMLVCTVWIAGKS